MAAASSDPNPVAIREDIEWCSIRWHEAPDAAARRVLLIGDSIAQAYSYAAAIEFKDLATYSLLATSRAMDDPNLRRETAYVLEGYPCEVIHFNNGIHGAHLGPELYAAGLRAYVAFLRDLAPSARLAFGATTPLCTPGTVELHPEKNPRAVARNAVAVEVMAELGIPVTDLYTLVLGREDLVGNDGTHFRQEGSILLGQTVGRRVREILEGRL